MLDAVPLELVVVSNSYTLEGMHPAWIAARYGKLALVEKFVDHTTPSLTREKILTEHLFQRGTILHQAALTGQNEVLKWLLQQGYYPSHLLLANCNPLFSASAEGECMDTLLNWGIKSRKLETVELLLDAGYTIKAASYGEELHLAGALGALDILTALVNHPAHSKGKYKDTRM